MVQGGRMPLLNYKKKFASRVEIGLKYPEHPDAKLQTIRARRKDCRNPKPGQTLYHYTGLWTKHTRKLGESLCKSSETIVIYAIGDIVVDLTELSQNQSDILAAKDGFKTFHEFMEFFRKVHDFPFYGFLIKW
jgi:hypothetical protein